MAVPAIPIAVTSTPIDWATVLSALFAAFLGAASAFAFNRIQEQLKGRQSRLNAVNSAIQCLAVSLNTMLNLKKQFLSEFNSEFDRALYLLGGMNPSADANAMSQLQRNLLIIFHSISLQDQTMNGVFKPWQKSEFTLMPEPKDLSFTVSDAPDLVRFIHVAKEQTGQITERIIERNDCRLRHEEVAIQDIQAGTLTVKTLIYYFEMINYRKLIREHTDIALIVTEEALAQLHNYRKLTLKKRNWLGRRIFGKEGWVTYKLPDRWRVFMPRKDEYEDVLGVQE